MNRYSIEADGRRWWWTGAAGGVAAMAAVVAVAVGPAVAGPDFRETESNDRSVAASPPAQGRPCYMVRTRWELQPVCGIDGRIAQPHVGEADSGRTVSRNHARKNCPEPPDPRYVGVPWVSPTPTGCATIDRWWKYVPAMRAPGRA